MVERGEIDMKGIAEIFKFDDMKIVTIRAGNLFSVYKDMGDCLIHFFDVIAFLTVVKRFSAFEKSCD